MRSGATSRAVSRTLPSSIRRLLPGLSAAKNGGAGPCVKLPLCTELAEAQLRTLEIDKDRDRPPDVGLDAPHGLDQRLKVGVRGVAHISSEEIDAGPVRGAP